MNAPVEVPEDIVERIRVLCLALPEVTVRVDYPAYAKVLDVGAGRVAMVRDFLATVTSGELAATRRNPHDPEHPEIVLSCLHVILEEEWEHHRYAVRDLDAIEAKSVQ